MRRFSSIVFAAIFFFTISIPMQAQDLPFARFPAISPDGSQVAFSWQGDIWTVPIGGGQATRLTVHEAYDARPKWSPDGQQLAFVSDKFGNDDLFVMRMDNRSRQRITHHSTDDELTGWTPGNPAAVHHRARVQPGGVGA